jgi:hypothetical protein
MNLRTHQTRLIYPVKEAIGKSRLLAPSKKKCSVWQKTITLTPGKEAFEKESNTPLVEINAVEYDILLETRETLKIMNQLIKNYID